VAERNYLVQAVILRTRSFKEHDKLVTMYSLERGKFTALARGAAKEKSSLRGLVQPFYYCNLALAKGRGSLDIITQGQMEEPFLALHTKLECIAYASYMTELIDLGMPDHKPNSSVFALILATYSLLELGDSPDLARYFFELRFLEQLGLTPQTERCMMCGRRVHASKFFLSPFRGGLICPSCHGSQKGLISLGTVQVMRHLLSAPLSKIPNLRISDLNRQELSVALNNYLDYHLEYVAKARRVLDDLLLL
jgi:DNA repair protein RecO (recombination protein O)